MTVCPMKCTNFSVCTGTPMHIRNVISLLYLPSNAILTFETYFDADGWKLNGEECTSALNVTIDQIGFSNFVRNLNVISGWSALPIVSYWSSSPNHHYYIHDCHRRLRCRANGKFILVPVFAIQLHENSLFIRTTGEKIDEINFQLRRFGENFFTTLDVAMSIDIIRHRHPS